MTPKEKAEQLKELFSDSYSVPDSYAKRFAGYCVDEILKTDALLNESDSQCIEGYEDTIRIEFWEEVKEEIELL